MLNTQEKKKPLEESKSKPEPKPEEVSQEVSSKNDVIDDA